MLDGGARVLIVDDHVMLRESMRVALELAGNDVVAKPPTGTRHSGSSSRSFRPWSSWTCRFPVRTAPR